MSTEISYGEQFEEDVLPVGFQVIDITKDTKETAEWKEHYADEKLRGVRYPDGWTRVLIAAVVKHNLDPTLNTLTTESLLTEEVLKHAGVSVFTVLDHQFATATSLIGEPYTHSYSAHDYDSLVQKAKKVAELLDVWLVLGEKPAHNEHCTRLRFQIPQSYDIDARPPNVVGILDELVGAAELQLHKASAFAEKLRELGHDPTQIFTDFCEKYDYKP